MRVFEGQEAGAHLFFRGTRLYTAAIVRIIPGSREYVAQDGTVGVAGSSLESRSLLVAFLLDGGITGVLTAARLLHVLVELALGAARLFLAFGAAFSSADIPAKRHAQRGANIWS
jgi:hypothetical protein